MPTAHYRMHVDIVHITIHTAIEWAGASHKIGQIILPKYEKKGFLFVQVCFVFWIVSQSKITDHNITLKRAINADGASRNLSCEITNFKLKMLLAFAVKCKRVSRFQSTKGVISIEWNSLILDDLKKFIRSKADGKCLNTFIHTTYNKKSSFKEFIMLFALNMNQISFDSVKLVWMIDLLMSMTNWVFFHALCRISKSTSDGYLSPTSIFNNKSAKLLGETIIFGRYWIGSCNTCSEWERCLHGALIIMNRVLWKSSHFALRISASIFVRWSFSSFRLDSMNWTKPISKLQVTMSYRVQTNVFMKKEFSQHYTRCTMSPGGPLNL